MWTPYQLVYRLQSPLSIHTARRSMAHFTQYYVPARTLKGAFVASLTENNVFVSYQQALEKVNSMFRWSYGYPSKNKDHVSLWPWQDNRFAWTFIGSRTNITAGQESLATYERECISASTRDGLPVYLITSILVRKGQDDFLPWQTCAQFLSVGGERRNGWGKLQLHSIQQVTTWFGYPTVKHDSISDPTLFVSRGHPVLAHVPIADQSIGEGTVEVVRGRETVQRNKIGHRITPAVLCYPPGSRVLLDTIMTVSKEGLWETLSL